MLRPGWQLEPRIPPPDKGSHFRPFDAVISLADPIRQMAVGSPFMGTATREEGGGGLRRHLCHEYCVRDFDYSNKCTIII